MSGFTTMCDCGGKYTDKTGKTNGRDRHESTIKHQRWMISIKEAEQKLKETEGNNNYTAHLEHAENTDYEGYTQEEDISFYESSLGMESDNDYDTSYNDSYFDNPSSAFNNEWSTLLLNSMD